MVEELFATRSAARQTSRITEEKHGTHTPELNLHILRYLYCEVSYLTTRRQCSLVLTINSLRCRHVTSVYERRWSRSALTSVDHSIGRHLSPACCSLLLVYPVRLEPMFPWDQSK